MPERRATTQVARRRPRAEEVIRAMPFFERHVFVCTNQRPDDSPKGCCAAKGAAEVLARFKDEMSRCGLKGRMRANASGCLDQCARGVSVVVYPEGTWYSRVVPADVREIVEEHLVAGRVVERLLDVAGRGTP